MSRPATTHAFAFGQGSCWISLLLDFETWPRLKVRSQGELSTSNARARQNVASDAHGAFAYSDSAKAHQVQDYVGDTDSPFRRRTKCGGVLLRLLEAGTRPRLIGFWGL